MAVTTLTTTSHQTKTKQKTRKDINIKSQKKKNGEY